MSDPNTRNHLGDHNPLWSMAKAEYRPGDFQLRRESRQLFANFLQLSGDAGQANVPLSFKRSSSLVETPVYDVPKRWHLSMLFGGHEPIGNTDIPLSPWAPFNSDPFRVTIRTALDRDKSVDTQVFTMAGLGNTLGLPSFFPVRVLVGFQVGVKIEVISQGRGTGSLFPMTCQGNLVEITGEDRDAYGNAIIRRFAQSAGPQVFLVPNGLRRQLFVSNGGTVPMYVAFSNLVEGPGPTSSYTFKLSPGSVYESLRDTWQGYVSGIWDAAGGADDAALVTEGG